MTLIDSSFEAKDLSQEETDRKVEMSKPFMEFLESQGYRPELGELADIEFKAEGLLYLLSCDPADEGYIRFTLPSYLIVDETMELKRVAEAVNRTNQIVKMIKTIMVDGYLWSTAEFYCPSIDYFKEVFPRQLILLRRAALECMRAINKAP